MNKKINIIGNSTESEYKRRDEFYDLFENSPIPKNEVLQNLGLYINRQSLSRILFMNDLYKKIVDVHGIAIEFGVRWGQNLALFESFRGIYEPYNYNRKIVGFDTFEGFKSLDKNDGQLDIIREGAYSVTENYEEYLEKILQYQESENPISNIKKYEIVKGDATKTIHTYLNDNPETIIALAYFDFDIYKPTKECLVAIKPYLTKGSVIGFDELNYHKFPGETIAFKEVFGLDKYKIRRSNISPLQAYIVIE
ncbi:UNVERIFIED_ORG: crotonobetainyl-CoA--carnitine CoA-transferase [Clostridium botulinum]